MSATHRAAFRAIRNDLTFSLGFRRYIRQGTARSLSVSGSFPIAAIASGGQLKTSAVPDHHPRTGYVATIAVTCVQDAAQLVVVMEVGISLVHQKCRLRHLDDAEDCRHLGIADR
jgi:hypothetical protein